MAALLVRNLSRKYGSKQVLTSVSFHAEKGTVTAILGGNGSGKSTLLSCLAGVIRPDSGEFFLNEEPLFRHPEQLSSLISYVPQGSPLFPELTALDNLKLWYPKERLHASLSDGPLRDLGIPDFLNLPVRKLSEGMKKRLTIGCASAGNPEVLLLDEPGASLDLPAKEYILRYIRSFSERGGIVLIATHDREEIECAGRHFLLKNGTLAPYEYRGTEILSRELSGEQV